jgi:predicted helicase
MAENGEIDMFKKAPIITERFNTYQFAEYKESVIELLGRMCTVSVETMKIVKEMP